MSDLRDQDLEAVVSGKAPTGGGAAGSARKTAQSGPGGKSASKTGAGVKAS